MYPAQGSDQFRFPSVHSLNSSQSSDVSGSESEAEDLAPQRKTKDYRWSNGVGGRNSGEESSDDSFCLKPIKEPKRKGEQRNRSGDNFGQPLNRAQPRISVLSSSSDDESVDASESEDGAPFLTDGNNDTIGINITQLPPGEVKMYNDLGGGFRKDAVVGDDLQRKVAEAFRAFKALVAIGDQKIQVDVDNRIVWIYKADGTRTTKNLDQLMLGNDDLIGCAKKLIELADEVWPDISRPPATKPGGKAPSTALAVRPSYVTKNIKNDYSTCAKLALQLYSTKVSDPIKQEAALRRITVIESIISQMQKVIDAELILERSNEQSAREGSWQKESAQDAIALLEKHSLKEVNRLGLYVAAAFASSVDHREDPVTALAAADQAAKDVQEVLQGRLDQEHKDLVNQGVTTWLPEALPDAIRGTPNPYIPKDETYAKWAAPLAYSVLREELARKGAANYWTREKSTPYKDGIEDELIRFVVRKESPTYTHLINTPMLDGMFALVKTRVPAFGHNTFKELTDDALGIFTDATPFVGKTMDEKVAEMNTRKGF